MKSVYSPANIAEAHMLAHLLEQAGIKAFVDGEALTGAIGELPAQNLLRVMVADDDYDGARQLVMDWEKSSAVEPPTKPTEKLGKASNVALLACLLAGVGLGWLANGFLINRGMISNPSQELDRNGDGQSDMFYYYPYDGAPFVSRVETDLNSDGKIDQITRYDATGWPERDEADTDLDGRFETKTFYREGIARNAEVDTDGDGRPNQIFIYAEGGLIPSEARLLDPQTGKPRRINYFTGTHYTSAEIDTDGDGVLDTRQTFDEFENMLTSKPM